MSRFWRKCRIAFRCARFTVWAAVLLLLAAFAWFNIFGLPNFLKTRLVTALHERGVDIEFSRMRLRIIHGLICDNVRVGPADAANGPVLTAREVQLRVNFPALLHLHVQVDGLLLRQGKLNVPLAADDALVLTNLQGELRIQKDDTWSLDQFRADLAGATITLGGEITHAPECRNWKLFTTAKTADHGGGQSSLKSFADALKKIQFVGNPQINVRVNGDGRDIRSVSLTVNARAPGVETPWFDVHDLQFAARVTALTNAPPNPDPALDWWTNLQPFRLEWLARGTELKTPQLTVEAVDCYGVWNAPELSLGKFSARLGGGTFDADAKLDVALRTLNFNVDSSFDPHAMATLLPVPARERLAQISWPQPPQLRAAGTMTLPPWTNHTTNWLAGIEPDLRLHGELDSTNALVAGAPPIDSLHLQFACTNRLWSLPDLELVQGRTALELSGEVSETTKNFRGVLGGKLDAQSLRPFLTTSNAARGFGHLFFREPVALVLDVTGNLRDFAALSVTGRVVATDFAIRGQWIDSVVATLAYTNLQADFFQPQLVRAGGAEKFAADKLTFDIAGEKLFIHGGAGRVSPLAMGEAIGPKTALAMEPYHFLEVPDATVDGCIPLKQADGELVNDDADLRFNLNGPVPFRWRKFQTPHITGSIHWLANHLILTNIVSDCYGGTAHGWGSFDVQTPGEGTDFTFFMDGTNVDFNAMGRALWSPTNQLRGALSGKVMVTSANSSDWRTWNGYGQAQLKNGLLWDAPVFGLVSPVLNTLTPGFDMGNNRATEGNGHFTMTKGVIFTDSLEIRSLTMRLFYVGTVDLEENIAARAHAQLLRNTPLLGSFFSAVLSPVSKALECSVTGTLEQPKIAPLYIPFPRVLTAPLHPIRTVEQIFSSPATNTAAGKP